MTHTPHTPLQPFEAYSGQRTSPRVLFVGEAWGSEEDQLQTPFVGPSGRLLFQVLGEVMTEAGSAWAEGLRHLNGLGFRSRREAWAQEVGVGFTNVLGLRPADNKLANVSVLKEALPKDYPLATRPLTRDGASRFLAPEYLGELERLDQEIRTSRPRLVVALGNTALWALTGQPNISAKRGVVALASGGPVGSGVKFLPTYHPSAVMHNYAWRPIQKQDLLKAWTESLRAGIVRPERRIMIAPELEDIEEYLRLLTLTPPEALACDIETSKGLVTCIGFAASRREALVVPFRGRGGTGPRAVHWWPDTASETRALQLVGAILGTPIPKLFQNGMYDLQYIYRWGLRPRAVLEDTMLMHHSMFPELQKSLGFLASIYTNEAAWKLMRHQAEEEKSDS